MKLPPMEHQSEALRVMNGKDAFGLLMEMGTGKTYCILADAERLFGAGKIDALFVLAPKGVHTNWILREIPTHLSVEHIAAAYSSGASKKAQAKVERLFKPRDPGEPVPLRVLAMNIDAINTKDGYAMAARFLRCTKAAFVIDESDRIKNPASARTKEVMKLQPLAVVRRICSGTPITNAPMDIFAQMEFLDEGLLGTTSYRSFTAEYADLLAQDDPRVKSMIAASRNPAYARPQVVARNSDGTPRWRNLDKLQRLLAPHTFRKLKRECLQLPDKIYQTAYFELTPAQRRVYKTLEDDLRVVLDGEVNVVTALGALTKLQQITSGFVNIEGEPVLLPPEDNPRMAQLKALIEGLDGKFIIWARYREELRQIAAALAGVGVVQYHGGVGNADREAAVDEFQNGAARCFLGQPQSGGIGLTLTAAETVIYYSNDFNLGTRLQSEDRAHRIGTKKNVVYIDLVAQGTIDIGIANTLQRKEDVASKILGDDRVAAILGTSEN